MGRVFLATSWTDASSWTVSLFDRKICANKPLTSSLSMIESEQVIVCVCIHDCMCACILHVLTIIILPFLW